jgi:hypothetical protein
MDRSVNLPAAVVKNVKNSTAIFAVSTLLHQTGA